ncbi:arylphorin subunit alpha [Fopius arisanus]|uniref:ARYA_4 protein n=1 Tax=Fopius arisanus TaxID=64838 RepID=A0A0C9PN12_9HYME|nr:PREDICTED: arylphorin subunit alpha-like [Fopius arisanus]
MLKESLIIFTLAALAAADLGFYFTEITADQDYIVKQKKIYQLFYHVSQSNIVNQELFKEGQEYSIEANIDSYTNKDAVNHFIELYKFGFLPRGEIFSLYYPKQLEEMRSLFKLFFYSKDFETFYKTALWARNNINEGQFFCALYQAVIRRPDTVFIQLPPPYEFYPYAFFNTEVIEAAKNAKIYNKLTESNSYVIFGNYSGWYLHRDYDPETKLQYFTEDIGLNAFYFFFRQDNPWWLGSDEFGLAKSYRGEEYLYSHVQLLNRYNLERLANGLERVENFLWDGQFYPGYYPTMIYHNGLPYPQRPANSKIPEYKYKFLYRIHDLESRISAAIDLGYVIDADGTHHKIYTPEGLNLIGNIIEGNMDTCNKNYYGNLDVFGRKVLGFNLEPIDPYRITPSAIESVASCLRDPAFYRFYQRLMYFYYKYKAHMKPYTKEEIIFPGLKFESIAVDKLVTYFDQFDTTISNGLPIASQQEADNFLIKIRQYRLNNKHFTVHFSLNSDKAQKVAIQLFLGPKYDTHHHPLDFSKIYKSFYQLDYWITDVNAGTNKLERVSHDFFFAMADRDPTEITYKRLEKSMEGTEKFIYKQSLYGFPERLLLPKGSRSGTVYQLFAYVSPVTNPIMYKSRVFGYYEYDQKPIGFPLDRPIYEPHFQGPNMFFKNVSIYLKFDVDPNATT